MEHPTQVSSCLGFTSDTAMASNRLFVKDFEFHCRFVFYSCEYTFFSGINLFNKPGKR